MTTSADLLREAAQVNYRLRSTFFLRKLKEYETVSLPEVIRTFMPFENDYDWSQRGNWGIGEEAFAYVYESPLSIIQVFCHPKLLRDHPGVTAYYRNVAALSQKAVQQLIKINVKPYEAPLRDAKELTAPVALKLATLFNEHATLIVDSSVRTLSEKELQGLLFASTGAQIDGSWRNAIGDEAEKVVQRLLINEAIERGALRGLLLRAGGVTAPFEPQLLESMMANIRDYRGFLLVNGTSVHFSSEPDISLLSGDGTTIGVIEVKGGADPAGALERYGAAKKSFEQTPDATTVLAASCITPEVQSRIQSDPDIDRYFNLTELLSDENSLRLFFDFVYALIDL